MNSQSCGVTSPFAKGLWRNDRYPGVLTSAVLLDTGNGVWLPAQIAFWPLKTSNGTVAWIIGTRFGQRMVRDHLIMAVNIRVWLQCWYAQQDVYLPAFLEHRNYLENRRSEVIQATLGYLPNYHLPLGKETRLEIMNSCHVFASRVMLAHIEGTPAPAVDENDTNRLMGLVRIQLDKLIADYPRLVFSRDLGIIVEARESRTPSDASSPATGPVEVVTTAVVAAGGVPPGVTATSVTYTTNPTVVANSGTIQLAQIFELDDNPEIGMDVVVSGPALRIPVIDIEPANSGGYFDPRATMDTPPLRNDSCTTINESVVEPTSPNVEESTLAVTDNNEEKSSAQEGRLTVPTVTATVTNIQSAIAPDSDEAITSTADFDTTTKSTPATAIPIPTGPITTKTPANTPTSLFPLTGQVFRERIEVDEDDPESFSVTSNPSTVPVAFAVMNKLSRAERAARTQNSDTSRSSRTKTFSTENPFVVPAKSAPSNPELRRSQSALMAGAISLPFPMERAKSEPKPTVRFEEPPPKRGGYLRPMYPEPKPTPPPKEPKPEPPKVPFKWERLDDFRSRVEDYESSALRRERSWSGAEAERPGPLQRRKSEGVKGKGKGKKRKPQSASSSGQAVEVLPSSTRRMIISDIQPRPYRYKHSPPRRLLPTSVHPPDPKPKHPRAAPMRPKSEPVFREVTSKRPGTITVDPRVGEPTATAEVNDGTAATAETEVEAAPEIDPNAFYHPMPIKTTTGGWTEPPRHDYGPRAYAIPFSSGLAFSQARRERMPVRSNSRPLNPLASQEMHVRRHSEHEPERPGQAITPQSQRQDEDNGEWAEMDPDYRGSGLSWREVFLGLCGKTERHEGRDETWNVVQH